MTDTVTYRCQKCRTTFIRDIKFLLYYLERPSDFFFSRSLELCDTHVRERELEILKRLPDVIKVLSEKIKEE